MELYHIVNRGVEKRKIVLDDEDRVRFVHDLFIFNDSANTDPNHRFKNINEVPERDVLVHLHAWCLMPNHYHLLLSEESEGGISLFMKKLNMGYAKYFNEKYERSGFLWQGKYRKQIIENDRHFLYLPIYIHCNPLDLVLPEWRVGGVKNYAQAEGQLKAYRWSSYLDFTGTANFPSLLAPTTGELFDMGATHNRDIKSAILASNETLSDVAFE